MKQAYPGPEPAGYGISLFLSRILKVKQTFAPDRILAQRLSENATYGLYVVLKILKPLLHSTLPFQDVILV